jgi:uncharacterized membrane protein required for colicin V production
MYAVPILASLIIWGFLKEPENNTIWGRIGLGSFIAFFMAIIFINDYIKKIFKNFELQDKNALLKNHAITFGLTGLLFSIAYFIAEDAILFCTVGFIAHTLALVFQLLERKYYKLWTG